MGRGCEGDEGALAKENAPLPSTGERANERFYAEIGRMGREDPLGRLHINDGGARGTGSQIQSRSNRQSRTQTADNRRRHAVSSE